MLCMIACTTVVKLPSNLSSLNLNLRQVCLGASHTTSTMRSSICSPDSFHASHSSSSTSMISKKTCPRLPPQFSSNKKRGLAVKSASSVFRGVGGNRSSSLKSMEFSEGGFHLMLSMKSVSRRSRISLVHSTTYIFLSVPGVYGASAPVKIKPSLPCWSLGR
jgi:hypothetical protein